MFDFLLYIGFVVTLLVLLLTAMQLFDDVLLSAIMISILMLFVATTMIINLM
jgi:hypothetical protein